MMKKEKYNFMMTNLMKNDPAATEIVQWFNKNYPHLLFVALEGGTLSIRDLLYCFENQCASLLEKYKDDIFNVFAAIDSAYLKEQPNDK